MRKQFNQFKDFMHNNLSRNEKQNILSQDVINGEKHLENIKTTLVNAEKKISNSLLSTPSESSSSSSLERRLKKLPQTILSTCFSEASNALAQTKHESIFSKTLFLCSQIQQDSALVLAEHEAKIESECIEKIKSMINNDLPSVSRAKKQLSRAKNDLSAAKAKYESLQKSIQNSAVAMPTDKLESLRDDVDDSQVRLQQSKDAYEVELLSFLSKDVQMSEIFRDYFQLQVQYHQDMLSKLEQYVPQFNGIFDNFSKKPIFGLKLEEHLRLTGRKISYVIETCIALLLDSIAEEGLFRISGSLSKVKLLRSKFDAGSTDWDRNSVDVHAVASTLKSYLRELPEPLFTVQLYNHWMRALAEKDKAKQLEELWLVCNNKLPTESRDNLCYLIKFLHEITKHAAVNKMSSQNLAIAIGPSLTWQGSKGTTDPNMIHQTECSQLIELLIANCDYFFPQEVIFTNIRNDKHDSHLMHDPDSPTGGFDGKQAFTFAANRKKPAPKPPLSDGYAFDNRIYPKIGSSLQANDNKPVEPLQAPVMPAVPLSVPSSPAIVSGQFANIRRNTNSRLNNKARPTSYYERPVIPPPEVPPRPSIYLRDNDTSTFTSPNHSNNGAEHIITPEPESMYPNLSEDDYLDSFESNTDSGEFDDYSGEDCQQHQHMSEPPPPQKPPRAGSSSSAAGNDTNNNVNNPGQHHEQQHSKNETQHRSTLVNSEHREEGVASKAKLAPSEETYL